jgi:hypothetical protein
MAAGFLAMAPTEEKARSVQAKWRSPIHSLGVAAARLWESACCSMELSGATETDLSQGPTSGKIRACPDFPSSRIVISIPNAAAFSTRSSTKQAQSLNATNAELKSP